MTQSGKSTSEEGDGAHMGTHAAMPAGLSGWVRGPKSPPPGARCDPQPAAGGAHRTAPGPARDEPGRAGVGRGESRDAIGWVQAHGGAGATSLAEVLGGVDLGARWPEPARGEPGRIMLVGRTSARGLRSVSRALGALEEGRTPQGLDLLGVVLVADTPGRLPLGLLNRIRVLRSVTHVHRVPWIPAWRLDRRPRSLPRQLATLAQLLGGQEQHEGAGS